MGAKEISVKKYVVRLTAALAGHSRAAPLPGGYGQTLFGVRKHALDSCDQTFEFDRFGIELVAPGGNGRLTLALHGMRGHADDWNVPGLWIVLETPHGFPTIVVRHFEVHEDHVRVLGDGQPAALLAVLRCENLEAAAQLEARLEHV
jgi:hypothetical protein